jgi:hypothetical protein
VRDGLGVRFIRLEVGQLAYRPGVLIGLPCFKVDQVVLTVPAGDVDHRSIGEYVRLEVVPIKLGELHETVIARTVPVDIRIAGTAVCDAVRVVVPADEVDVLGVRVRRWTSTECIGHALHRTTIERGAVHARVPVDLSIDVGREEHPLAVLAEPAKHHGSIGLGHSRDLTRGDTITTLDQVHHKDVLGPFSV